MAKTARLGKHQLCLLATMASPFSLLIVDDKVALSLVKRGLLAPTFAPKRMQPKSKKKDNGGFFSITPAGLRALADAFERRELEQFLDPKFRRDRQRLYMDGRKRKGEG